MAIETPGTLPELQQVVARAASAGNRVRVSASGHSFSDCALTKGVMVRLDGLTKPLDFDSGSGLFKVEGGAVLSDLNRGLDERERLWKLATDFYPGFQSYQDRAKDRTIPVVVCEPAD